MRGRGISVIDLTKPSYMLGDLGLQNPCHLHSVFPLIKSFHKYPERLFFFSFEK